ncbi:MAG: 50S ribosomal protein L44e [Caldivirga sp.]
MKIPRVIRTYCPRCRTYTEHTVTQYTSGKRRTLSEGQRRYDRKLLGYGSTRKPRQKTFYKVTKKVTLKLTCRQCGYITHRTIGRLRKVELVETR